jgi:hypothetical protein
VVEPLVKISLRLHEGDQRPGWPGDAHHRVYLINDRVRGQGARASKQTW